MTYTLRTCLLFAPIDHIALARRTDQKQGDPHYSVTAFVRERLANPQTVIDRVCAAGGEIVLNLLDGDHAEIDLAMPTAEGLREAEGWIAATGAVRVEAAP